MFIVILKTSKVWSISTLDIPFKLWVDTPVDKENITSVLLYIPFKSIFLVSSRCIYLSNCGWLQTRFQVAKVVYTFQIVGRYICCRGEQLFTPFKLGVDIPHQPITYLNEVVVYTFQMRSTHN